MRSTFFSSVIRPAQAALFVAAVLSAASCGEVARTGRSSAFLIVESLEASSGADPSKTGSILNSDVETLVDSSVDGQTVKVPTVFNDTGTVAFRNEMKNPVGPTSPGSINDITISRYHVAFRRADGRNTPGVDVPYAFDGAFTVTVPAGGSASSGFDLVRHQSKKEPPLSNMRGGGGMLLLSVIAEVTFYGRDQAGHEVSVTGSLSINFADFGDPS